MRPKPVTISLRDILKNQEISFLPLGTSLLQVAGEMGPPRGWITDVYAEPVPLFWTYPGGMELHFEPETPYPLSIVKLSAVGAATGKVARFSYRRRMRIDFPIYESQLSAFLKADIWDLNKVQVGICTDMMSPALDICVGNLRINFHMTVEDEEVVEEALERPDFDLAQQVALFDPISCFMGAYFLTGDPKMDRMPSTGWTTVNAREYLDLLDQKG
jgi:hypothetical protein